MPLPAFALALAPFAKSAALTFGPQLAARAISGGGGLGRSRAPSINPQRISGNAFAQGCIRFGVGSAQCPVSGLEQWARISERRYPNAFAQVFQPLLQRQQVSLGFVQGLARDYLGKRQSAQGFQQAAQMLLGGSSASRPRGLRL